MVNLSCQTELRHLNQIQRSQVEKLLNESDSWKELIAMIPKVLEPMNDSTLRPDSECPYEELLINNEKCSILEKQKLSGSPSRALLDYWSTYEVKRPTIEHLIYYAAKCRLYRLVDYLLFDLLKSKSIDQYSIKTQELLHSENKADQNATELGRIDETTESHRKSDSQPNVQPIVEGVKRIDFDLIKKHKNNFDERPLKDGGNKVGEGGFGVVYLAKIPKNQLTGDDFECELNFAGNNYLIAVKVVANEFKEQYNMELKNLAEFRHPNLLNLIGLAYNETTWCILSEYMINNSLQNRLLPTNIKQIDHEKRIEIIGQIIDAVCYLHTAKEAPLIHRDIKSSNILLDRNLNAKLCDFGLARTGSLSNKTMNTFNIIGTSVYMSPDAFKGQISVKIDTFSFGIVLLEILTGLPSIDEDREENQDILSYMHENIFADFEDNGDPDSMREYESKIVEHLDKKAGNWKRSTAIQLFDLARKSTNYLKSKRPTMIEVKNISTKIVKG